MYSLKIFKHSLTIGVITFSMFSHLACKAKLEPVDTYESPLAKAPTDPTYALDLTVSPTGQNIYNQFKITQTQPDQYSVMFNFIPQSDKYYEIGGELREATGCSSFDFTVSTTWLKKDQYDAVIAATPVLGYESFIALKGFKYAMLVTVKNIKNCSNISYGFTVFESSKTVPKPTPAPTNPATGVSDAKSILCQNTKYKITADFSSCPFTTTCNQEITAYYTDLVTQQTSTIKSYMSRAVSGNNYSYSMYEYANKNGFYFYTQNFITASADLELNGTNTYNINCYFLK